jgi:DNA-binding LacI/PurR family transcriptional regulator
MLNRSGTIGVVIPTLTNTIFAQSLAGFQQRSSDLMGRLMQRAL